MSGARRWLWTAWRWYGHQRAVVVIPALFLPVVLLAATAGRDAAAPAAAAVLALEIAYCFARPRGGLDAFLASAIPNAGTTVLHGAFGWRVAAVAPPLIALALYILWDIDREARPDAGADLEPADSGTPA